MNSQGSSVEKNTQAQKYKCKKISSQTRLGHKHLTSSFYQGLQYSLGTRLGGEIYSSDVIVHKGY